MNNQKIYFQKERVSYTDAFSFFILGGMYMAKYLYDGPVMEFGRCINNRWVATTSAPSEGKAKSNLSYRYKKEHGRSSSTRVVLSGKLVMVD